MKKEGKEYTSFFFPVPRNPSGNNFGCFILSFFYVLFLSSLRVVHINTSYYGSWRDHVKYCSPLQCLKSFSGSHFTQRWRPSPGMLYPPPAHCALISCLSPSVTAPQHLPPALRLLDPSVLSAWTTLFSDIHTAHSVIFSMSLFRYNFLNNSSVFSPCCSACFLYRDSGRYQTGTTAVVSSPEIYCVFAFSSTNG